LYQFVVHMKNLPKINHVYDPLHGVAYYTFLKFLRSLEEFRKNSHAKIPSKSPWTNFQSSQKNFKFQKKIEKVYYLYWAHLRFSAQPRPTSIFFPQPATSPPPFPAGPRPLGRSVGLVRHVLVVPCPLAASLTGRHLQPCHLCPSPRPANRWAPPIIPHLQLCPSLAAPTPLPTTLRGAQLHTSGCRPETLLAPPSLPP
jgi:hypothetical protein